MCDATSARIRRTAQHAPWAKRLFLALEYVRVRQIERQLMRVADHALFISCRDREDLLGAAQSAKTSIVPNGVDLDYWRRSTPRLGYRTIVFTGAMGYRPNTDAALYLIREILPAVERQVAHRWQGSAVSPPAGRTAPQRDGDRFRGGCAPLSGASHRVCRALALRCGDVASPLAADGLRTEEGHVPPVRVAADPETFAEALVRTLREREATPEPDREARRFVEQHFVWGESGAKLDRVLRFVCRRAEQLLAPSIEGATHV